MSLQEQKIEEDFSSSNSGQPDLDWSQVRETVKMLQLVTVHIMASMKDGNESVDDLGHSFTSMASSIYVMHEIIENHKDKINKEDIETLEEKCEALTKQIQSAIIAFQFYDRITQQLDHVCYSLNCLSGLVSDPKKIYRPYEWHALQNQIRSAYNMDTQREIFDALMSGESAESLVEKLQSVNNDPNDSDIEMF